MTCASDRMRVPVARVLLVLVVVGLGTACGTDAVGTERTTFYQDVAPILADHCMTCHQDGGIAPFALTDYESARDNSERMLAEIERGAMPPFDAREEPECTPRFGWVDDPRLSETELQTLQQWVEDGHPEGTITEVPPIPNTDLSNSDMTLVPAEGWATSGTVDQYVCYVLDPGNTELEWLSGLQVRPGNDVVVHHAVVTELRAGAATDQFVNDHGIGKPFECINSNGLTNGDDPDAPKPEAFIVHTWTPGSQPMQTSGDIAIPVFDHAKLVVQIHYHPAGLAHEPDVTSVDLRFSKTWPIKMYFVALLGNAKGAPDLLPDPDDSSADVPQFTIPKNVADHHEHMRFALGSKLDELGDDVRLFSVTPHMHMIGTHLSAKIERPSARGDDPQTECLANGTWDFDWQRTYTYDASLDQLPSVANGDIIDIDCAWNNTADNANVQRMLEDNGRDEVFDVKLGEQTVDEMCLEIFGVSVDAPLEPVSGMPAKIEFPSSVSQLNSHPAASAR